MILVRIAAGCSPQWPPASGSDVRSGPGPALLVPSPFNEVHAASRLPGGVQRVRADSVGSTADTMSCRIAMGDELLLRARRLRREI